MARSDLDDLGDVSEEEVRALQPPDDYDSPSSSIEQRELDARVERDNRRRAERIDAEKERIRAKERKEADRLDAERERELARQQREIERQREREEKERERLEKQKVKDEQRQWDALDRQVTADNRRLKREEAKLEKQKRREEAQKKKQEERERREFENRAVADNKRRRALDKEVEAAEKDAKRDRMMFDKRGKDESRVDYLKRQFSDKMLNKSELKDTTFAVAKTFGNVIVGGVKKVISDGHGRSGKRATLAWRRENREYNSEARRMRSQVSSPGIFNSKLMFGENRIPERSRYAGKEVFGNVDPLAQFSMVGLGMKVAPQGMRVVQERHRQPQPRLESPKRLVKKGKKDPLKDFNDMIGGF